MNPSHLHILQHSPGCDPHGRPTPLGRIPNHDDEFGCYRNRFVTDPTSPDGKHCQELVAQRLMHDHGAQSITGGMHCYSVTQAGYEAMKAASQPPPKISRSKRRWAAYREIRDALDMTFAEYLRWPRRKEHEATFQL